MSGRKVRRTWRPRQVREERLALAHHAPCLLISPPTVRGQVVQDLLHPAFRAILCRQPGKPVRPLALATEAPNPDDDVGVAGNPHNGELEQIENKRSMPGRVIPAAHRLEAGFCLTFPSRRNGLWRNCEKPAPVGISRLSASIVKTHATPK